MHLFMLVFLGFFAALSWKQMQDKVMRTWRNIIAAGFFFTAAGTAGFYLPEYQTVLSLITLLYWVVAPAFGFYTTSEEVERYADLYRYLGFLSAIPVILFAAGFLLENNLALGASFISVALIQTTSILIASKMDHS